MLLSKIFDLFYISLRLTRNDYTITKSLLKKIRTIKVLIYIEKYKLLLVRTEPFVDRNQRPVCA